MKIEQKQAKTEENTAKSFTITDNVFGFAAYKMLHLVAKTANSLPKMERNIYMQHKDGTLGQYGANEISEPDVEMFGDNVKEIIENVFKDNGAKIHAL